MSWSSGKAHMSSNIVPSTFGILSVVQGRAGGWPGQSTWTDPTKAYIISPLTVQYPNNPSLTLTYQFPDSFALPSNPSNLPLYVTLFDGDHDGKAAIYIETDNTKFQQPLIYVRLGILVNGVTVCDWSNPASFGPSGVNHSAGSVPDPGAVAGSTHFLREDAVWAVPAGGGGGAVNSVFTRVGTVVAQNGDYSVAQVTGAAPLASPALTGTPTAPTPATSDNTTKLATTAFVNAEITTNAPALAPVQSVAGKTGAVTLVEGDITNLSADLAAKASLASPALTGTPSAPTPTTGDNTTLIATTAFVNAEIAANAPAGGVKTITANYTILNADKGTLLVVTGDPSGNITLTLPNPGSGGGFDSKWFIDVQNDMTLHVGVSTNLAIISNPGLDSGLLFPGQGMRIFSDGSASYWSQRGTVASLGVAAITHKFVTAVNSQGNATLAQPTEADLSMSDITTNDVSITKHGFVPKAPNDITKFLNGLGTFTAPPGGSIQGTSNKLQKGGGSGVAVDSSITDDGALVSTALPIQTATYQFPLGSTIIENGAGSIVLSATGGNLLFGNWRFSFSTGAMLASGIFSKYNNILTASGTPGLPPIYGSLTQKSQTVALPTTAIFPSAPIGLYRVSGYLVVTGAGTSGTISINILYTDEEGAQSFMAGVTGSVGLIGGKVPFTATIRSDGAPHDISLSTTFNAVVGTPTYSVYATCEQLMNV